MSGAEVVGRIQPMSEEERAEVCAEIRAMVAQLDQLSTAVARGNVSRFDFQLAAYELVQLSKRFRGI